jgi:nucleotide-binding universal stress UspA family protein
MAEWSRICCAIDFSDSSRVAMQEAAVLARRLESWLTLVHVYVAPAPAVPDTMLSPPEFFERLSREAEETLERWRAEAEGIAGRPVRSAMPEGNASAELLRFASEGGYDLIVMATHGRTGFRRLVLGSVAERVVREANCSVLVVRRPAPTRTG